MPKRKYATRRRRRRRYPLKRRRRRKAYVSRFVPSGLPASRTTRMRFVHSQDLIATGTTLTSVVLSANSLYNPLLTSLSVAQPMGFDQLSVQFNRYMVIGSRARVIFNQQDTTAISANAWVGVHLSDETNAPYSSFQGYIEAKKGSYGQLITQRNQMRTLTCNFSPKGWFNITDLKDNAEVGSVVTGNPAKQCYFHLWQQHVNNPTSTRTDILVTIIIDYIVLWSDPVELARS